MSNSSDVRGPVELLADEFLARLKVGEKPTIGEYCARHPELAEEIRDVFEALLMVEDLKPGSDEASASFGDSVRVDGKRLERIADYRILREIGRGGMGVVYEAEQEALGRRVALKVLPKTQAGDGKALIRFQREAKAAARMHHTNIVPVFDVGQDGEHVFYAMQLIHGQGLDLVIDDLKRLRDQSTNAGRSANGSENRAALKSIAASLLHGQFEQENLAPPEPADSRETTDYEMSPTSSAVLPGQSELSGVESNRRGYYRSVAQIGLQTASALAYAHARGIIHRDIKPGNLLLDAAGNVWVTDFGLAKTGDGGVTHTGDILGTIRYMAPERFRGQCDVRADVYALGLTLYELLALKPAYASADRFQLIEQIRQADPSTPRSLDPRLPLDLDTIVVKAIDKDPRRRYQSADELAEDLQRFVADEPIKARRIGTLERFARWCRRNPAVAASLAATMLILVVGLSLVTWKWDAERKARADATTATEEVEKKAAELRADIESMNTANGLMQSGREFQRIGDYAKATQFFSRAANVRRDHSGTWLARGQLYKFLGLWELAREDYARAAALAPLGLDDSGFSHAFLSLRVGDRDEFARTRDAMLRSPDIAEPDPFYSNCALRTCILTADRPDAIRSVLTNLERLPTLGRSGPWNDYFKGIAHYRLGEYERALECLQRSIDPSREWEARELNYPILAMVHLRIGQPDEARKALETARLAAERWDNQVFTASSQFVPLPTVIDWWEFLWYYEEACKLITGSAPPASPRRLVVHARALAAIGKAESAAREFRDIAAMAPKDPLVRFACFQFHVEQKRLDDAAMELAAVVAAQPKDDAQRHIRAFRVYADNGDWAEAKAQHRRAIQLAPADRKIALEHFRYHADRGEWPQADAAYAEQIARSPEDVELRVKCAELHMEASRWERVLAEYAKILPLRRDDVWGAWYPYALMCLKTGHLEEYRKTCAELFQRFEKTTDLAVVMPVSIVCKLAPNTLVDPARLVEFSRGRLGVTPGVVGHCLYRNGQYSEAVELLTKAILDVQGKPSIWDKYFLAMAYQRLGKYEHADRWLMEGNQALANEAELASRVRFWTQRLDLELLRDEAEQLILGKGRHRAVIAELIAKGEWQAALDRLDILGKDNELNSRDWTNRGRGRAGLLQWDKTVAACDKAIALGENDYGVWFLKGIAHNRSREYQKALAALERAEQVAKRPDSGLFHERALAFDGLRQFDKALAAADRAIELGDNSGWLRFHRGNALAGLRRNDEAISDLSETLKEAPTAPWVWRIRGACYAETGQWSRARADFAEALRLKPEHSEFHYELVIAELAANNLDGYRAECKKMRERFGNTTSASHGNNIGYVAVVLPDSGILKDDLVRLARQAVALFAGNERLLGAALVRAGQYEAAIEQFDKSNQKYPRKGWDWFFLAMAHHNLGHAAEAQECMTKGKKWIEEADKKALYADTGSTWIAWSERVEVQHLRAEAESLMAAK
jgi:serine/threonine protein kinase/Flp pilus assembly protein TadD